MLWPPTDEEREGLVRHYLDRLQDSDAADLQKAVEYETQGWHPFAVSFHMEALKNAIASVARRTSWGKPEAWTREDFIHHVTLDLRDGKSGSKRRIAQLVAMSPTALWRLWEKVRREDEPWPSGRKGPPDRRRRN